MRTIINKKAYDTSTAERLVEHRIFRAADEYRVWACSGCGNLSVDDVLDDVENLDLEDKFDCIIDVKAEIDFCFTPQRACCGNYSMCYPYELEVFIELYRKKTGEYFATCRFDSDLSGPDCSETAWEETYVAIKPLADDEVEEWVMQNLPAEDYESIFGEVPE